MSKYTRDRQRVWHVVVRNIGKVVWCPTSLRWFNTRKECQAHINQFRNEHPEWYSEMEHKPMMYLPADVK